MTWESMKVFCLVAGNLLFVFFVDKPLSSLPCGKESAISPESVEAEDVDHYSPELAVKE